VAPTNVDDPADFPEDPIELELGAPAAGGACVAHGPDGRVVFVRHGIPGERVVAQITATNRSFLRADVIQVLVSSPHRVDPPCPHAGPGRCGGCDFQHIALPQQREMKAALIEGQLQRLAGLDRSVQVESIGTDDHGLGWRTRVRLGVDGDGKPGFHRHRSHELEYISHCPIACTEINSAGAFASSWLGAREIEVVVVPASDEIVIDVDPVPKHKVVPPHLPGGLVIGGRVRQAPGAVEATVLGKAFRVSAGVFWQAHSAAAEVLATAVLEAAQVREGESVVDLFAGAGLFSVLLAHKAGQSGSVLAVERSVRACNDARHNGQGVPQLTIKKASITANLIDRGIGHPDVVVLDPSRQGAGKGVMAALAQLPRSLRRIVYVACDPASFARDLSVLLEHGWEMTELRAFDIFPMTEHVELVATIDRSAQSTD
jgi:tRNA/tmRNA/rRNA uracil-C5-methylase (TrmA/RlmC/RlmD family)